MSITAELNLNFFFNETFASVERIEMNKIIILDQRINCDNRRNGCPYSKIIIMNYEKKKVS
jgi:hypothetical protein